MSYFVPKRSKEFLLEKFEASFSKKEGECWDWQKSRTRSGYGYFYMGKGWPGGNKGIPASRASWILYKGEIPSGMIVCHHCDNPACVNPSHLFLGTDYDNTLDKLKKGRQSRGEKHSRATKAAIPRGSKHYASKITEEQVKEICELRASGLFYREIAAIFNMETTSIWKIATGKRWQHVNSSWNV